MQCRLGRVPNKATVLWGPLCPARIVWLETRHEPGQPDNDMTGTRSPHLAAFVSGVDVSPYDLRPDTWHQQHRIFRIERAITRAEYDRALVEIAAAVRANVYEPRCRPFEAVRIDDLPLPFSEDANGPKRRAAF